ncbi:NAD-dependent succinate-semialdehyde dehydrogenase [Sinimarinibacterium sp. NLF-5-8]|uniref:NAD-dependent succinate-semialdehyde dehydrogenase n=1 Tax=Sinimarinibacterium sp. NLF-5-8 TaxID=2698684 RepID=UPI00137C2C18|nr:NAD-dependent succinate-semialdehyde dehydrogenase [Sinimarinibacterium sp. NLF-5-8]QHS09194.1 NAD-dependent succinate-semialdehyde dehydrogenase [Sinimarinibacterium sp. NLF-5-8]
MHNVKREACFINGQWISADAWITVKNPADGSTVGRVPKLGRAHTQDAINAAHHAMQDWAQEPAHVRSQKLRKLFELMMANQDALAALLTAEQGKPLAEARGEIAYAASFIEWFAEEARRGYGDVIPAHSADMRILALKQPVGVVAVITPWNFPAAMITRKIGPALAAGCGVVIKPASQTPFSALALGVLAEQAGFPAGLINIITGSAQDIGGELTQNPRVRKLSFTGSTQVGSQLYAQCAPTVKKLSLELGGNAPFIVFDDADLDAAVTGVIQSKFRNAGQTCICANRIYAQDTIHDAFVEKLTIATRALKVGNGTQAGVEIGPLIDTAAVEKVESHLNDALAQGATIHCGGHRHALGGTFFEPTVISGARACMLLAREETFGPLAPVFRFSGEADVINQANDTEFGLAGYFYARDVGRIWRVAEQLQVGIVGVNSGAVSTTVAPFGGIKASGFGREGSKYGMEDYLQIKYVCLKP